LILVATKTRARAISLLDLGSMFAFRSPKPLNKKCYSTGSKEGPIKASGWVKTIRKQKQFTFLV
jgi:hypothetical protein